MSDTLNLDAQFLCEATDLQECRGSVVFEVMEWGRPTPAFAVRFDNQPVAYLNRCAHVPAEMDWQPGEFWDQDQRYIMCSVHGALYEPPTGQCVAGPCVGRRLIPIRLEERSGRVYWYPTKQLQPAF